MSKTKGRSHAMPKQAKFRANVCFGELRQWVAQVIASAERNGDVRKKTKFQALQAELV